MNRFGIKYGIILGAFLAISYTSVVVDMTFLPIQGTQVSRVRIFRDLFRSTQPKVEDLSIMNRITA